MPTIDYIVTGMTCSHCEQAVSAEVLDVAGVHHVDVDAGTGRLTVQATETINDDAVIAAVEEAGYSATRAASA